MQAGITKVQDETYDWTFLGMRNENAFNAGWRPENAEQGECVFTQWYPTHSKVGASDR